MLWKLLFPQRKVQTEKERLFKGNQIEWHRLGARIFDSEKIYRQKETLKDGSK